MHETVGQAIFITSGLDIVCLQIHDNNFFIKQSFPLEHSKVIVDSILFTQLSEVKIDDNDLLANTLVSDQDFQYIMLDDYQKSSKDHFYYIIAQSTNNTSIESAEGHQTHQSNKKTAH